MIQLPPKSAIASIDVHAQYSFTTQCPDELPAEGALDIVDELNEQAKYAKYRIGSKEVHSPNAIWLATPEKPVLSDIEGENVDVRWPAHSIAGTKGVELIKGLPIVTEYDYFIWEGMEPDMHPYGICFHDHAEKLSTGVIEFLESKQVKTVLVGGLVTEYCVRESALQLASAGFQVILNLAACCSLSDESATKAIKEMQAQGVQMIKSSKELKVTS